MIDLNKSTNKYIFATPHSLMYMNYDYWFTYDLKANFMISKFVIYQIYILMKIIQRKI